MVRVGEDSMAPESMHEREVEEERERGVVARRKITKVRPEHCTSPRARGLFLSLRGPNLPGSERMNNVSITRGDLFRVKEGRKANTRAHSERGRGRPKKITMHRVAVACVLVALFSPSPRRARPTPRLFPARGPQKRSIFGASW